MNREAYKRARGKRPNRIIADAAGTDVYHLSRIINGHVAPNVVLARRIADALGATLDELWPTATEAPQSPPPARKLRSIKGGAPARPPKREAPTSAADAGRAGGLARARALTPEQLSAQAKHANRVRWSRAAKANAMSV